VNFLRFIGRLRPGVSRARAEQALMTAAGELRRLRPDANARKAGIGVTSLHAQIVGDYALTLRLLLAAVTMVLLLACVNLASLLLARTAARRRELSIRVALGVGRRRLIGQLLIESLAPAAAAGGLGLTLAAGASRVLLAVAPASMPRAADVSLDPGVVLFAVIVTAITGVAVALGPAVYFSRVDPAEGLRGAGRASGAPRSLAIRRALVGAEVAISLVLAVATTLLAQSLRRAQQVDPGFTPEHVLSMRVSLSRERYVDRASVLAFQRRLEERLRGLPGVQAVGGANLMPLSGMSATMDVVVDGRAFTPNNVPEAEYRVVSEGFFDAMGIRRLAGRTFTARDTGATLSVAVINRAMADRFWPNEDPVGRRLRVEPGTSLEHVLEVVGVVGDVKHFGLDGRSTMDLYIPFAQLLAPSIVWIRNNQFWMIRADGDPLALAAQARAALAAADPDVPAAAVRTLEQAIDGSLAARRFNVWLVALFGYAALALTSCGMYAVSAQTVAERSREFGIRSALGASPRNLVGLVLRTDVAAILAGVGVGLVAARGSAGALGALLFDVRATDPGPYAVVALALAAVAAAACLVPASRAGRIDPLRVIRSE
jgi:putative ABC transport system permease protein